MRLEGGRSDMHVRIGRTLPRGLEPIRELVERTSQEEEERPWRYTISNAEIRSLWL